MIVQQISVLKTNKARLYHHSANQNLFDNVVIAVVCALICNQYYHTVMCTLDTAETATQPIVKCDPWGLQRVQGNRERVKIIAVIVQRKKNVGSELCVMKKSLKQVNVNQLCTSHHITLDLTCSPPSRLPKWEQLWCNEGNEQAVKTLSACASLCQVLTSCTTSVIRGTEPKFKMLNLVTTPSPASQVHASLRL